MSYPYNQGPPPAHGMPMPGAYPPNTTPQPTHPTYMYSNTSQPQTTSLNYSPCYPVMNYQTPNYVPTHPPISMPMPMQMPMPMPTDNQYRPFPSQPYVPPPHQHQHQPQPQIYSNYTAPLNTMAPFPQQQPPQQQQQHQRVVPKIKNTPTVRPAEPFDPRADAETLRKAMKGFGTDEKAIIQVLANRTNAQRLQIAVQFKTLYGKDLNKDLKSELSGKFEDLILAMMMPLPQFYAKEVHDALSGIGTDEDTLIEVFCTMTNNEIRTIRAAYEAMYGSSLENDLVGDTSGTFRRLMVSLCTANRDESMMVNPGQVQQDCQSLLRAGEMRFGTDESTFNAILCQRNYAHLQAVFEEYQRVSGHDFEQAIKNEFSGDAESGLLAVVRSVKNKATFFAKRLHESMKGMGTNDQQLVRLIVTRSETDLGDIKNAYQAKYGKSLADEISSDTSGDYKKCLLALIA